MDFNKRELALIYNALKYVEGDIKNTLPWRTMEGEDVDNFGYVKEIQQLCFKVFTGMNSTSTP